MKFSEIVNEVFNTKIDSKNITQTNDTFTQQADIGNRKIIFLATKVWKNIWNVSFSEKNPNINDNEPNFDITNSGYEFQVFSFVINCIKEVIILYRPDIIEFLAEKNEMSRIKLYKKMSNKIKILGYHLDNENYELNSSYAWFFIVRDDYIDSKIVNEVFDSKIQSTIFAASSHHFSTRAFIGNRIVEFYASRERDEDWEIGFLEKQNSGNKTFGVTGSGKEFEVFSFVKNSLMEFIERYKPERLDFSAAKEGNRVRLYKKLIDKIPGYHLVHMVDYRTTDVLFALEKDGLNEDVTDANDKFKAKRNKDFQKKIQGIADGIPGLFQKQRDLEKYVNDKLVEFKEQMNRSLNKYRLELAPIAKEYQPSVTIPELLYFSSDQDDEHYQLAKNFFNKHSIEILKVLEKYEQRLLDLAEWSKQQKWPAGPDSLNRYTQFGYDFHSLKFSMKPIVQKFMKADK